MVKNRDHINLKFYYYYWCIFLKICIYLRRFSKNQVVKNRQATNAPPQMYRRIVHTSICISFNQNLQHQLLRFCIFNELTTVKRLRLSIIHHNTYSVRIKARYFHSQPCTHETMCNMESRSMCSVRACPHALHLKCVRAYNHINGVALFTVGIFFFVFVCCAPCACSA